ncbi:MAG TPA: phage protein Gp27 family protein [Verrucomicrobiae bacterium]|nr:phage protein Gp27 family protein [Verrucomicrobiae bacterium]
MNEIIPLNDQESALNDERNMYDNPAPLLPRFSQYHRRTGKIAKLPRKVRNQLNEMIDDGVPYLQIIARLGTDGEGLTEDMLSKWKNSGYHEWIDERRLSDAMRARYEFAHALVTEAGDAKQASQAVLHTIATNLCRMLAELDPAALCDSLLGDADKFSRFVNAMVRLAEGSIKFDQHTSAERERQAAAAKASLPPEQRGVSAGALAKAEAKLNLL